MPKQEYVILSDKTIHPYNSESAKKLASNRRRRKLISLSGNTWFDTEEEARKAYESGEAINIELFRVMTTLQDTTTGCVAKKCKSIEEAHKSIEQNPNLIRAEDYHNKKMVTVVNKDGVNEQITSAAYRKRMQRAKAAEKQLQKKAISCQEKVQNLESSQVPSAPLSNLTPTLNNFTLETCFFQSFPNINQAASTILQPPFLPIQTYTIDNLAVFLNPATLAVPPICYTTSPFFQNFGSTSLNISSGQAVNKPADVPLPTLTPEDFNPESGKKDKSVSMMNKQRFFKKVQASSYDHLAENNHQP